MRSAPYRLPPRGWQWPFGPIMHAGHLQRDHLYPVETTMHEYLTARYQSVYELEVGERVEQPWDLGLDHAGGPGSARVLHLLFAPEPHAEWGGGLAWRCGPLHTDAASGATVWCHKPTNDVTGRYRHLREQFRQPPTSSQQEEYARNRQESEGY